MWPRSDLATTPSPWSRTSVGTTPPSISWCSPRPVSLAVGQTPTVLDLEACVRNKVNGTVTSSEGEPFSAKMSFSADDLDSVTLTTNGSYSLYLREGNYSLYVLSEIGLDREAYFDLVAVTGPLGLDLTTQPA